jgi:hypothetical protein
VTNGSATRIRHFWASKVILTLPQSPKALSAPKLPKPKELARFGLGPQQFLGPSGEKLLPSSSLSEPARAFVRTFTTKGPNPGPQAIPGNVCSVKQA